MIGVRRFRWNVASWATRTLVAVAACATALALGLVAAAGPAQAQQAGQTRASGGSEGASPRAVIAFLPATERLTAVPAAPRVPGGVPLLSGLRLEPARDPTRERGRPVQASVLDRLDRRPDLSLGLLGATQGPYSLEQTLLDITQGTRTSQSAYRPPKPPELGLVLSPGGAYLLDWPQAVRRAEAAPQTIIPGLLAGSVRGGAGYAGAVAQTQKEAIVAADRGGRIAAASVGRAGTLARRGRVLLRHQRLVVVALTQGRTGLGQLDRLRRRRRPGDLLLVIESPPDRLSPQLLAMGVAGLGGKPGTLTSATTRRDGIVAGIDVLPTVLRHLGLVVPGAVKGQPIEVEPGRDAAGLRRTEDRLRVVSKRRIPSLRVTALSWLALLLALSAGRGASGFRAGLRIGGLAMLWLPSALLLTAALEPPRPVELVTIAAATIGLAALTDVLVPWPRGPWVPAAVGLALYGIDLARDSDLIVQSLFGPNPRFGSRYYGLGNELEATLPLLLWVGLAGWLSRPGAPSVPPSRRGAWTFGLASLVMGAVVGSGRLGADVGGVVTIGAGGTVAVLLMLPGGVGRRALGLAVLVPVAAVAALAGLDLLTGADSHFTRNVLQGQSAGDLLDTVKRRFELAYAQLGRGAMPWLTPLSVLLAGLAVWRWRRVYAPVADVAPWRAALGGGLAGAVVGALANDSGPLLLVYGVVLLALVTAYVRGDPRLARAPAPTVREAARAAVRQTGVTRPERLGTR